MKILTWNVNGLRSVLSKGKDGSKSDYNVIQYLIDEYDPDIICLQETKCPEDLNPNIAMPFQKILSSKTRKGYSGVAVFSKQIPLKVYTDFPENEEGRVIIIEYERFFVINTYTPNSKQDLSRLHYRVNIWEPLIRETVNKLQKKKPIIYVSDFNVAPTAIDIHTVKGHERAHGFTIEERTAFAELLETCNLVDTYRDLHSNDQKYTWFSNFAKSRERNKGWRIDHILVSKKLQPKVNSVDILSNVYGSDHIPVIADIDV